MVPRYMFLTKGKGVHKNKLESFELALRDAGIQMLNLVSVSSIMPPGCQIIPREEGVKMLSPGQVVFLVLSQNSTDEPRRMISASVGLARPRSVGQYGYISEHHDFGLTAEEVSEKTEDMAASMLASTLGIPFNPEAAWDERKQVFEMANFLVETQSMSETALGYHEKDVKKWTTVVAAAVLVP